MICRKTPARCPGCGCSNPARRSEALRLRFTQRAQRHTRLQPHAFTPCTICSRYGISRSWGFSTPRPYRSASILPLSLCAPTQHLFNFHQPLGFQPGFVARACGQYLQSSGQAPVLIDSNVRPVPDEDRNADDAPAALQTAIQQRFFK